MKHRQRAPIFLLNKLSAAGNQLTKKTQYWAIALLICVIVLLGGGQSFAADQASLSAVRASADVIPSPGTLSLPPMTPITVVPGENIYLVLWVGPLSTNRNFSSATITLPAGFVTTGRGTPQVSPGMTGSVAIPVSPTTAFLAGTTWYAVIGVRAPLVPGSYYATGRVQDTTGSTFAATGPAITVASPEIAVNIAPPQSTAQTIAVTTAARLNLLTPSDGATSVPQPVQFSWQSVQDTVTYRVLASDKSDLSRLYAQWDMPFGATTSYYNPRNDPLILSLSSGTWYYWRVQALDGTGRILASSSIQKFQIAGTTASQTLKHDVAIDKITIPAPLESGVSGKINVTISNKGTFPESNSSLQLFAKGQSAGTLPVPILNVGETKEITFPYTAPSPGTIALSAILSQPADEDMRNNVANATADATGTPRFNFPEAPAGVYTVKPGAPLPAKLSGFTPGGTIQAYNAQTTGPGQTSYTTKAMVATGAADSSGNASFTFTPTSPGHWVMWFVDTKSRKTSNMGNFSIAMHDLAIATVVGVSPYPPLLNTTASWTMRVTNKGNFAENWIPVRFSIDGVAYATQYINTLPPGASQDVTFTWTPIVTRCYSWEIAALQPDDATPQDNRETPTICAAFTGPATQAAALGAEDTGAFGRAFQLYGGTPVLGNSCDRGGGTGSHRWGPGWTQNFCGGSAGDSALMQPEDQTNILWVHGSIWQRYLQGNPDNNPHDNKSYGYPTTNELPIPASPKGTIGVYQIFKKGIMVFAKNGLKAGQVLWTTYDVGQAWIARGAAGGPLGFPTSEEYTWNGTPRQDYEGGYITWTGQANVVLTTKRQGDLRVTRGIWIKDPPVEIGKYFDMQYWVKNYGEEPIRVNKLIMALRGPGGENCDPIQDLTPKTIGPGEEVQVFVPIASLGIPGKPGVYTAFASYEDTNGNWREIPTAETGVPARRGFGVSLPAGATTVATAPPPASPTPQSGQPAATGSEDTDAFAKAFALYGGTPVLGIAKGPSHEWGAIGWIQDFSGGSAGESALIQPRDQGKILWVHGSIWQRYKQDSTRYGKPRGNEEPVAASPYGTTGVKQEFENGTMYWMQNGPHQGEVSWIRGGIRDTWAGTASKLGFPLGEERKWRDGDRQDFEGGYIAWSSGKGNITYQDINDRSLYKAAFVEKSSVPTLQPSQEATIWVKVRNTGEVSWFKGGQHPINLGTATPQDRQSLFWHDTWAGAGQNRPATMKEDTVLPGDIATFEFKIKAPKDPNTYHEAFQPVAEFLTWFGEQVAWDVMVEETKPQVAGSPQVSPPSTLSPAPSTISPSKDTGTENPQNAPSYVASADVADIDDSYPLESSQRRPESIVRLKRVVLKCYDEALAAGIPLGRPANPVHVWQGTEIGIQDFPDVSGGIIVHPTNMTSEGWVAFLVRGGFMQKYIETGGPNGILKLPRSSEYREKSQLRQKFESMYLYQDDTGKTHYEKEKFWYWFLGFSTTPEEDKVLSKDFSYCLKTELIGGGPLKVVSRIASIAVAGVVSGGAGAAYVVADQVIVALLKASLRNSWANDRMSEATLDALTAGIDIVDAMLSMEQISRVGRPPEKLLSKLSAGLRGAGPFLELLNSGLKMACVFNEQLLEAKITFFPAEAVDIIGDVQKPLELIIRLKGK